MNAAQYAYQQAMKRPKWWCWFGKHAFYSMRIEIPQQCVHCGKLRKR